MGFKLKYVKSVERANWIKIINYKELFTWVMEFLIFWYLNKLDIQFAE